jgi:predicted ATPase with chaperone activity
MRSIVGTDFTRRKMVFLLIIRLRAQARHRILKITRTIAGLDAPGHIGTFHLTAALSTRRPEHK